MLGAKSFGEKFAKRLLAYADIYKRESAVAIQSGNAERGVMFLTIGATLEVFAQIVVEVTE